MGKQSLVIVESPTKAKTITRILGEGYVVVSSMGHLIDLPRKKLGVEIENNFKPEYCVIPGRQKTISSLEASSQGIDTVYVATDPDREGEAIGWQIKERIFDKKKKVYRVVFHEITPQAVSDAFKNPREFDSNMLEAQAGRRILDRIVGYFLSPLLWKKIARGLSAGRVQSVALRLIVERERAIQNFLPREYWDIEAQLCKKGSQQPGFIARLEKVRDKKVEIANQEQAERLLADIKGKSFFVAEIKQGVKKRYSPAPFITSTLQQEAFNQLKFNAGRTMLLAQQLYEGVDIGKDNPVGLITYMRTDSPRVAPEAINQLRGYILKNFGAKYLPPKPNVFKVRKSAQEAHEAIRPSSVSRKPEDLKEFLTAEQYKLYELIYRRFVASQMKPAQYSSTSVSIKAADYLFGASGSELIFDGFLAVYDKSEEDPDKKNNSIPPLKVGEELKVMKLAPSQHFTKPPARYSDSSLVKALEEDGIGRPSTYAPIIHTLIQRDYCRRVKGYFCATELGIKVCDMLVEYFPKVMDIKFTAAMEEELDEIEEGLMAKEKVLQDFYAPFKNNLEYAQKNIKKEVIATDEVCDKCGKPMIIKWGRRGKFLSCSDFPKCKNAKSITTGVKCPEPECGGELIERRSYRGIFYGCSGFPKCKFTARNLPA